MAGLSDFGLYSRTLLIFNGRWDNVVKGQFYATPAKQEPLITVALDLSQGLWIARGNNWQLARSKFFGALSGTAKKSLDGVRLETPRGDVLINQYFMNDAPRRDGPAFRGLHPNGGGYAQRSYWWRYDDPSMMTPFDRMAEMLDRAVRSPKLKSQIKDQFGGLISPEVLLPLAGTFFCLFGAEFVGGAAAVLTVARLLNVGQFLCDYQFYEPRALALHRICMSAAVPKDLEYGADLLVEILCQLISDLMMMLGITALSSLVTRLFSALITAAPESVRLALKNNAHAAAAYIRGKGYARTDLLQNPRGTPLEPAAIEMYKKTSEQNREVLVVREPDAQRATWVNSTLHHNSKPAWLKAQSSKGWHGLVCLDAAAVKGNLKPSSPFDVAGLRGFNAALDAEHLPSRLPTYEMPLDGREISGIDYHYTGNKNVELQGHKLVNIGGKYLLVDAMGRPYVSDLDLATRQRPGLSNAGDHIDPKLKKHGNAFAEDSPILEWEMNQLYHKSGGHLTHNPNNHGGAGATAVYTREGLKAGKKPGVDNFWTPKTPDGYKQERLVIFIPEWNGRAIQSQMYVLNSWADFKAFAKANNLEFPW